MKISIALLLSTHLFIKLASSENMQPEFLATITPVAGNPQLMTLSTSPFYHYEKMITNFVMNMVNRGEEQKVYLVLKNIIEIEKKWRMDLCIRVFGPTACSSEMSSEAFYLWKKTLIHNLQKDPTQEITNRIWANLAKQ